MVLVHALEAVCDLLPWFTLAAMFPAFETAGLTAAAVLGLVFLSSLLLEKAKALRILWGLLPALGLCVAKSPAQALFALPAVLIWLALVLSGKNEIGYEDYKRWFTLPAVAVILLELVNLCFSAFSQPVSLLSVVCGTAYLAGGILVLRRKRLGAGVPAATRLLNAAELAVAGVCGVVGFSLLWKLLLHGEKLLELLGAPLFLVIDALTEAFIRLISFLARHQPMDEAPAAETAEATATEIVEWESAGPHLEPMDDALVHTLGVALSVILILAILALIFFLAFRAAKKLRGGYIEEGPYEDARPDGAAFENGRRRKRKRAPRTNNGKVREIYRAYLEYLRKNGVTIYRQSTSQEVLESSRRLAESPEAAELRALYIRARYDAGEQLSADEVLRAKELWRAIRKTYESR